MHLEMCVCEMVAILSLRIRVNSSPPSAAYIRQWIGSEMVQIMACRLFGTYSKPMLSCCWLGPWAPTSMKFQSKYKTFHSRKKTSKSVVCEMAAILSRGGWVKEELLIQCLQKHPLFIQHRLGNACSYALLQVGYHIQAGGKEPIICRLHFQMYFVDRENRYFDEKSLHFS